MPEASLRYYACGFTEHNIGQVFHGQERDMRTFPSGVFLFEHTSGQRVLYDTGYAPTMEGTGIKGALYSKLLPPFVQPEDSIEHQLKNDGIDPRSIGFVVLSHLHPDHIGGVRFFPESQFIISEGMQRTLQKSRLREGFIKALLPDWFDDASKTILSADDLTSGQNGEVEGYDLFGDNSYLITELPGHAQGQLGALVLSKTLLAGDASWGREFLTKADDLKLVPRTISHDSLAYSNTAHRLLELEKDGVNIIFSHDARPKGFIEL
ncbi:MAG: MBL fold metallo-hydrolase [Candidatus Microsaccharimonas sp.]